MVFGNRENIYKPRLIMARVWYTVVTIPLGESDVSCVDRVIQATRVMNPALGSSILHFYLQYGNTGCGVFKPGV